MVYNYKWTFLYLCFVFSMIVTYLFCLLRFSKNSWASHALGLKLKHIQAGLSIEIMLQICHYDWLTLYNEKTMEHSDHWIMTGWHGEQWDFQYNGTFWPLDQDWMAWFSVAFSKQWKDNGTFWSLDPECWQDRERMAKKTVGFAKQWKDNTEGTSKQRKDNGTLWSLQGV